MAFREHIDLRNDRRALIALAEGALENATDLVSDARALSERRRWPRVVFLAQIASEELGKVVMCVSGIMQIATGEFDSEKFHRRFKHHKSKLHDIIAIENLFLSDDFDREMSELANVASKYESTKMLALYSGSFTGDDEHDCTLILPREFVSEEMATNALKIAEGRLGLIEETFGRWVENIKAISDEDIRRVKASFMKMITPVGRQ